MYREISFDEIKENKTIRCYIEQADRSLEELGYTEHSYPHVMRTAETARMVLEELNFSKREAELAKIAGFMHDIGNVINRIDHAQSGAVLAFNLLTELKMPPQEIAIIINAIGNHDEGTAAPVNPISAALIIGDKTDVRESRVRNSDYNYLDIHDRVNYAVKNSKVYFSEDKKMLFLNLTIDTSVCAVMDYFEIFLERMLLCRKAAEYLCIEFKLIINNQQIL